MSYNSLHDSAIYSFLIKGSFTLLVLQNFVLTFLFFGENRNASLSVTANTILGKIAFYLDIVVFSILVLIGLIALIKRDNGFIPWILIILGCLLFVLASITWRTAVNIYPQNFIHDSFSSIFLGSVTTTSSGNVVGDLIGNAITVSLAVIWSGLLYSNFGLLLLSIGLAFRFHTGGFSKFCIIMYGIANLGLTFLIFLVPLKVIVSLPLILIYGVSVIRTPIEDLLD